MANSAKQKLSSRSSRSSDRESSVKIPLVTGAIILAIVGGRWRIYLG